MRGPAAAVVYVRMRMRMTTRSKVPSPMYMWGSFVDAVSGCAGDMPDATAGYA